jgi:selenocysteine-specific elongation factor
MPVDRAFSIRGTGTVVTGTVWSGSISKDDTVFLHPGGRALRVRGIQTHGRAVSRAAPGHRTAIALANCDVAELERGMVLVDNTSWSPTTRLLAHVHLANDAPPITTRTRLRFHLGTAETEARLSLMSRNNNAASPRIARLTLDEPVIARAGDRFVFRLPSPVATIGGGIVLDPYPVPKSSRLIAMIDAIEPLDLLRAELDAAGPSGIDESILPIRLGLTPADSAELARSAGVETIEDRIVSRQSLASLSERLEEMVRDSVANSPLEAGVQLQTLRAELRAPASVIDRALLDLIRNGRVELDGALVRPAGWSPRLSERQLRDRDAILHEIRAAPSDPPSVGELQSKIGSDAPALLRLLTRSGELVKVSEERYYSTKAVRDLIGRLRGTLDPEKFYPPTELRDVLGISRKYLIPFLEYCDRAGITERGASGRRILPQNVMRTTAKDS